VSGRLGAAYDVQLSGGRQSKDRRPFLYDDDDRTQRPQRRTLSSVQVEPLKGSDTKVTEQRSGLALDVVPGAYAICRFAPGELLPPWVMQGEFFSVTRTPAELSAVCDVAVVPDGVEAEGPWSMLAVRGPLAFNVTGVLAGLATPLANAGISIFAVSTYDTDYVLVRNGDMDRAVRTLREAGHSVSAGRATS
jgi:uncharacterized protein